MRATVFAVLLVGCGGASVAIDGGADASADSAPDVTADAGACTPVSQEGTPCSVGEKSCDRVDLCCASAFTCTQGAWKLSGQACLLCQSHPCGPVTCPGSNMCITRSSGVDGGTPSYDCVPYPTGCARDWTCGCVEKHLPPNCFTPNGCTDTELPVRLTCAGS